MGSKRTVRVQKADAREISSYFHYRFFGKEDSWCSCNSRYFQCREIIYFLSNIANTLHEKYVIVWDNSKVHVAASVFSGEAWYADDFNSSLLAFCKCLRKTYPTYQEASQDDWKSREGHKLRNIQETNLPNKRVRIRRMSERKF